MGRNQGFSSNNGGGMGDYTQSAGQNGYSNTGDTSGMSQQATAQDFGWSQEKNPWSSYFGGGK